VTDNKKDISSLLCGIHYSRKKFYCTDPGVCIITLITSVTNTVA
jgi:hypothetical protein